MWHHIICFPWQGVCICSGEFLHTFGEDKLRYPRGVCVAGQYVYVTDGMDNRVRVFTTKGPHMDSLVLKRGTLFTHWECVDVDGFLYVCDRYNNT